MTILSSCASKPAPEFIREQAGIHEYRLANGLRVLLKEDHSLPIAALNVVYFVGSGRETEGFRGATHLLEHMMFKDTEKYRNQNGNAIFTVLQKSGARINGATYKDRVEFYESFPVSQLDSALDIEAQRMRSALLTEEDLKSEMPVVQSEFDKLENSPQIALELEIWKAAFQKHAYHYPVIGTRQDIESMTSENLRRFYNQWIHPENAVLILIGDFKIADALKKIEDKFAGLKKTAAEKFFPENEPEQTRERHVDIRRKDFVQAVGVAYKAPAMKHPDAAVFEVIAQILSGGPLGRLYRPLIETGKAAWVQTDFAQTAEPGVILTKAVLNTGAVHKQVDQIIREAYGELSLKPVTEAELIRAKNILLARGLFLKDGILNEAIVLGWASSASDWTLSEDYLRRIAAVTAADIRRVAETYFKNEKLTTGYLISEQPLPTPGSFTPHAAVSKSAEYEPELLSDPAKRPEIPVFSGKFGDRIQATSSGGMKIITAPTGAKGIVSIVGILEGAGYARPEERILAELTANLLDKGTNQKNQYEIANFFGGHGADWNTEISGKFARFEIRCLSVDVPAVLELAGELLRGPVFSESALQIEKEVKKAEILANMSNTLSRAYGALTRLLYPAEHPNYILPFEEQLKRLEAITADEIKKFHSSRYGRVNLTFIAAGDADHAKLVRETEKSFSDWQEQKIPEIPSFDLKPGPASAEKIFVADKVKTDVLLGHTLPLRRKDSDYLPAYVGNEILGGDFTGRLLKTIRVEKGLTYGVVSLLNGITDEIQGAWIINLILNRSTLSAGLEATREVIKNWAKGITEEELLDKIAGLRGRFYIDVSTTAGMAEQLAEFEELGLGEEYMDQYPENLSRLKEAEVNAAIRKYFRPAELQTVIAGNVEP